MAPRQPVMPNGDGTFSLDLRHEERALIATIVPDLRSLRPDDPEAEAEFQGMVRDDLVSKRLARLDLVAELAEAAVVDQEQLAAWMGAVNDIRLVLGTRLGVTEEDEFEEADEDDPEAGARSAYWYLGWLLEHLVEASASEL